MPVVADGQAEAEDGPNTGQSLAKSHDAVDEEETEEENEGEDETRRESQSNESQPVEISAAAAPAKNSIRRGMSVSVDTFVKSS
eukprot:COSAG05_NODE_10746_length_548_cov_1.138085_1_plen_83_part_10